MKEDRRGRLSQRSREDCLVEISARTYRLQRGFGTDGNQSFKIYISGCGVGNLLVSPFVVLSLVLVLEPSRNPTHGNSRVPLSLH